METALQQLIKKIDSLIRDEINHESTGLLHGMPETVERYFDYEAFGRDLAFDFMEFNGYYFSNY